MARGLVLTEGFTHHTDINILLLGGERIRVRGLVVEMPEDLKEFTLVLHRPHNPLKGHPRFNVSEMTTGKVVGRGGTKQLAVDNAIWRMRQHDVEVIRMAIDLTKVEGEEEHVEGQAQKVEAEKLGSPTYASDSKVVSISRPKKTTK